jgi:hypothetical protein
VRLASTWPALEWCLPWRAPIGQCVDAVQLRGEASVAAVTGVGGRRLGASFDLRKIDKTSDVCSRRLAKGQALTIAFVTFAQFGSVNGAVWELLNQSTKLQAVPFVLTHQMFSASLPRRLPPLYQRWTFIVIRRLVARRLDAAAWRTTR